MTDHEMLEPPEGLLGRIDEALTIRRREYEVATDQQRREKIGCRIDGLLEARNIIKEHAAEIRPNEKAEPRRT